MPIAQAAAPTGSKSSSYMSAAAGGTVTRVELNRGVAVAMPHAEAGLALIDAILARGDLTDYHLRTRRGGPLPAAGQKRRSLAPTSGALASPGRAERRFSRSEAGRAEI